MHKKGGENSWMRKLMLAGAVALAMMGSSAALAGDGALVVTDSHLAHFHSALDLRPDQERHWANVVATVHAIARRQNADGATLDGAGLKRLISAAMPLFRQLDTDQKRKAMQLARALGISSLASLF
jgi:hypothetical protein